MDGFFYCLFIFQEFEFYLKIAVATFSVDKKIKKKLVFLKNIFILQQHNSSYKLNVFKLFSLNSWIIFALNKFKKTGTLSQRVTRKCCSSCWKF